MNLIVCVGVVSECVLCARPVCGGEMCPLLFGSNVIGTLLYLWVVERVGYGMRPVRTITILWVHG